MLPDLSTLPAFAAYFGLGVLLLAVFCTVHVWLTPQREFALIRHGNVAASISLGGARMLKPVENNLGAPHQAVDPCVDVL